MLTINTLPQRLATPSALRIVQGINAKLTGNIAIYGDLSQTAQVNALFDSLTVGPPPHVEGGRTFNKYRISLGSLALQSGCFGLYLSMPRTYLTTHREIS
ncbi:hypothetical protein [Serratia marcescens]|uniref:hypothetical protein n=1 Tax=Serratia marcescens TaxID=615 RepID=UPI0011E898BE|nr:hypothetical protein [Serratia marcescens]